MSATIESRDAAAGLQRWGKWAAYAAAAVPLPSCLWRVALAAGVPVGFSDEYLADLDVPGWGSLYVVALSAFCQACALLALGLVRPWGEVAPRQLPWIGGRVIPPRAVIIPAALVTVTLTAMTLIAATTWGSDEDADLIADDLARSVMTAAYAPLLLWGPLLAIATYAYHRRRRAELIFADSA